MISNSHHSDESRKKMSLAHQGKKMSNEACKKMSVVKSGSKHPMYGRKHNKSTRDIMSQKRREWWANKKDNQNMKENVNKEFQLDITSKCGHYSEYGKWCNIDCEHCNNYVPKDIDNQNIDTMVIGDDYKKMTYLD